MPGGLTLHTNGGHSVLDGGMMTAMTSQVSLPIVPVPDVVAFSPIAELLLYVGEGVFIHGRLSCPPDEGDVAGGPAGTDRHCGATASGRWAFDVDVGFSFNLSFSSGVAAVLLPWSRDRLGPRKSPTRWPARSIRDTGLSIRAIQAGAGYLGAQQGPGARRHRYNRP